MKLRGPGEIYGKMQHGDLNLKIASLADTAANCSRSNRSWNALSKRGKICYNIIIWRMPSVAISD
ncbi:hypothetical protein KOY49_02850 [Candidatus Minimicrobia vallesae]|uniref:Uncharacterized protein n=1 Tax=Candidatus Minimicrobia vallesae TaxID=2841264 RepID=A0A8F1SA16_9BACT|nr:hypothetical protein [Candidatus Minimicrobia vallesae]QWQ31118.1 hypothetical protein KOY49_02850 [Candidatus Minimicrobia vallesae]